MYLLCILSMPTVEKVITNTVRQRLAVILLWKPFSHFSKIVRRFYLPCLNSCMTCKWFPNHLTGKLFTKMSDNNNFYREPQ